MNIETEITIYWYEYWNWIIYLFQARSKSLVCTFGMQSKEISCPIIQPLFLAFILFVSVALPSPIQTSTGDAINTIPKLRLKVEVSPCRRRGEDLPPWETLQETWTCWMTSLMKRLEMCLWLHSLIKLNLVGRSYKMLMIDLWQLWKTKLWILTLIQRVIHI